MKVAILVFSPTGNTLKVGKMLEKELVNKAATVTITDVTRNEKLRSGSGLGHTLRTAVAAHDVLCVGGPVYFKYLFYGAKDMIRALPAARNGWGKIAVPFITWGGVSSGVAL